jgi:hypothetical protein
MNYTRIVILAYLLVALFLTGMDMGEKRKREEVRNEARRCWSIAMPCRLDSVGIVAYPIAGIKVKED